MAQKLSNAFGGVTIVQKGSSDLISNGKEGKCHCLQKPSHICFAAHPVGFHSACMWCWRWIEAYGRPRWYIVRCHCYLLGMGKRLRRRGLEVSTVLGLFFKSIFQNVFYSFRSLNQFCQTCFSHLWLAMTKDIRVHWNQKKYRYLLLGLAAVSYENVLNEPSQSMEELFWHHTC